MNKVIRYFTFDERNAPKMKYACYPIILSLTLLIFILIPHFMSLRTAQKLVPEYFDPKTDSTVISELQPLVNSLFYRPFDDLGLYMLIFIGFIGVHSSLLYLQLFKSFQIQLNAERISRA